MTSTFKVEFYSRAACRLSLLAEVFRVELCRVGVEPLVVVDPRHVDVQHVTLLQGDFRASYPDRYSCIKFTIHRLRDIHLKLTCSL